jgi:valacyclovir hydrolase
MFRKLAKTTFKPSLAYHQSACRMASVAITEQKATVGAQQINYVKSCLDGRANEPKQAVLLMPGALGSAWTDFKPQIEKLPHLLPQHAVIAWDPPGYGKSIPPSRHFSVDFFEEDATCARNLMLAIGFPRFSVLGWSDGGITGMILAANHAESVEKLVIWGANAYILPEELKIYESIRDVSKWSARMREPLEKLYGADYFAKTWSEWVDVFHKIYAERKGNLCRDKLERILAKTLVVHGAKDPMIAAEHVPALLNGIKGADLHVFPEGKHNIHLKYADEFNMIVSEFLKK